MPTEGYTKKSAAKRLTPCTCVISSVILLWCEIPQKTVCLLFDNYFNKSIKHWNNSALSPIILSCIKLNEWFTIYCSTAPERLFPHTTGWQSEPWSTFSAETRTYSILRWQNGGRWTVSRCYIRPSAISISHRARPTFIIRQDKSWTYMQKWKFRHGEYKISLVVVRSAELSASWPVQLSVFSLKLSPAISIRILVTAEICIHLLFVLLCDFSASLQMFFSYFCSILCFIGFGVGSLMFGPDFRFSMLQSVFLLLFYVH